MTEQDYENRLAANVVKWSEKYPDQAAKLRVEVRRKYGKLKEPPPGSLRAMVLDRHFQEAVRLHVGWPTCAEWLLTQR